jgi:hypothetical protein
MPTENNTTPQVKLGRVYLPTTPGTPVGRFEFVVERNDGNSVEVGMPVAADTTEGTVVGTIVDMRTVGSDHDPITADLASDGRCADLPEVVVAQVQVFHSKLLRPVRAGIVRAATKDEMLLATGYDRMDWPIPAGVVPLADGTTARICFDGTSLLGPEAAHLNVGGLSGQAAKTSYIGMLLRSAIHSGGPQHRVASLVFNVKGEDLIWLDEKPTSGYELTSEDLDMYKSLGIPATPFEDVTVYAPSLPAGSDATRCPRQDALPLGWDLAMVWRYLKYFINTSFYDDEKLTSFLYEFGAECLNNPDHTKRVDTFDKLDAWFKGILERPLEEHEKESPIVWRAHHRATVWRIRRMLSGAVLAGSQGLVVHGKATNGTDIPDSNWHHGQVIVVDIAGLSTNVQSAVIARTIERLLKSAADGELGVDHLVVVADELNAFAPSQGAEMSNVKKVLQKVSTQGRYAGISLWGAGQKLSKIDEMIRDNAATRALGITSDGELASGIYGSMSSGLVERIATLPKGYMALSHYSFRSTLIVRFPRPAWRTGKSRTTGGTKLKITSVLDLSPRSLERLSEGNSPEIVDSIISSAGSQQEALEKLQKARIPDMKKVALHEPSTYDPENPYDFD